MSMYSKPSEDDDLDLAILVTKANQRIGVVASSAFFLVVKVVG